MARLAFALALCLAPLGCAREARPIRSGGAPQVPVPYGWPPPVVSNPSLPPPASPLLAGLGASTEPSPAASASVLPRAATPSTPPPHVARIASADVPGGDRCVLDLMAEGVSFKVLDDERGVDTPIEVTGPIGGVSYGGPMVCDCRLALALARVAPVLRDAGVSAFRYPGAYSYRMSRVGRLSLHAYGLAIDVPAFVIDGTELSVKKDFARGRDWCAADSPPLNQLACRLKATGLFRELLTPDYNADHHDHFHLGIAPLEGMPKPPKKAPPKPSPQKKPEPAPKPWTPDEVLAPDDEPTVEPESPRHAAKKPKARREPSAKHRIAPVRHSARTKPRSGG
jgi:hypothetical protein